MRVILVSLLLLAGCAHERGVNLGGGTTGHLIECGQLSICLDKAVQVCPRGYDVLTSGGQVVGGTMVGSVFVANQQQNLLIRCKDLPTASSAASEDERIVRYVCGAGNNCNDPRIPKIKELMAQGVSLDEAYLVASGKKSAP